MRRGAAAEPRQGPGAARAPADRFWKAVTGGNGPGEFQGGSKLLLQGIAAPDGPPARLSARVARDRPDVLERMKATAATPRRHAGGPLHAPAPAATIGAHARRRGPHEAHQPVRPRAA